MQKNRKSLSTFLAAALALAAAALFLAACDVDSVDSVTATPSDNDGTIYNFSGLYAHSTTNGLAPLVFPTNRQSGAKLTWLRLIQYGSVLEAYDNAGLSWSGSISGLQTGTATFSLQGRTTAGQPVDITGTMVYADQRSTMDAAWIEPSFSGTIYAQAIVAPSATNTTAAVSIDPTSAILTSTVSTKVFSATGGNGTYTWSHTGTCGTLSATSGSSITYTRVTSGNDILTIASGGDTASATIVCQ